LGLSGEWLAGKLVEFFVPEALIRRGEETGRWGEEGMKKGGYQIEREGYEGKREEVYEIERGHYGMVCHTLEVGQLVRWWTRWLSHWLSGLGVGGQWFQSAV